MSGARPTPLRVVGGMASPSAQGASGEIIQGRCSLSPAIAYAAVSRGGPRNPCNQDRHLVVEERALFAVLDGMGGHQRGDLASAMAGDSLRTDALSRACEFDEAALAGMLSAANHRLYVHGHSRAELRGMGATVALLQFRPGGRATLLHAGDCRIYRLRDFRLRALTRDHSRAAYADLGKATVKRRAERGVTRALGVKPQVAPELTRSDWQGDDQWLLTSDGVTDVLPEYALTNLMVESGEPLDVAGRIVRAAVEAGTSDDATAVVIVIDEKRVESPAQ